MAEYVMKHLADRAGLSDEFVISSAATSREETGNDMYPAAKQKLREKGIPFGNHAARQVTKNDYPYYDVIYVMDRMNLRNLLRLTGEDTNDKVRLLMQETDEGSRDVAYPWYTGDFERAYQDIYEACSSIVRKYIPKENQGKSGLNVKQQKQYLL